MADDTIPVRLDNEQVALLLDKTIEMLILACTGLQLLAGTLREDPDEPATNVVPLHPPTPPAS